MSPKSVISIIDDNHIDSINLSNLLSEQYNLVNHVPHNDIVTSINDTKPELIFVNISGVDFENMEICHHLKSNSQTNAIPIICLSKEYDKDLHLAAYEKGVDDFISMPYKEKIFKCKIAKHIENYRSLKALKLQQEGLLLLSSEVMKDFDRVEHLHQFTIQCYQIEHYDKLMSFLIDHLKTTFHLSVLLRIKSAEKIHFSAGKTAHISELDKEVIESQREEGIREFGARTMFTHGGVTLLVKNIPNCEVESNVARLKDYLDMICLTLSLRIKELIDKEQKQITALNAKDLIVDIRTIFSETSEENAQAIISMQQDLQQSFHHMHLTDDDEDNLNTVIGRAIQRSDKIDEINRSINKKLETFVSELNNLI